MPHDDMPNDDMPDDDMQLLGALRAATAGLLYPSESDEPFTAFVWKATETDAIRQIAAPGNETAPLKETTLDQFFAELTSGERRQAFTLLRQALESRLGSIRVLRLGEIEVQVYLIGRSPAGNWAGVKTVSVET